MFPQHLDVDPRVRTFLELRERTFTTHWTQCLGKKSWLEFDKDWRAERALEWRNACIAFEQDRFWTFECPTDVRPLCWFCRGEVPASRRLRAPRGRAIIRPTVPARYCSDRCKSAAWTARNPERRAAIEKRHRENRRRRQTIAAVA